MEDDRDLPDEKKRLGNTALSLRRSKRLSRQKAAEALGVGRDRVSEIESGRKVTPELIEELAARLRFRTVHWMKALHFYEELDEAQRRPFDPIGPTPEQEVALYEFFRKLSADFHAEFVEGIRSENLKQALERGEGQWDRLKDLTPARREDAVRRDATFHTWELCLFLCKESVRQASDEPKKAIQVGRLAVVVARCCVMLDWADRLVAYALAHFANGYRVANEHDKADKLFAQANRLWHSPAAAAADPGVLDPGRIYDLEASLRKDQRKLAEALDLLKRALPISRVPGRILINKAVVLSLMGSYEGAIGTLMQADALLEDPEPDDVAAIDYNMGVNLCHLGRFEEAAEFADSAFEIAEASENRMRVLRCHWLRARVFDGQGDRLTAVDIYQDLIQEFEEDGMAYDRALVTLELAGVHLALGQTRECRLLAAGLPAYFGAKGIHQEALAALKLFYDSVQMETATEALARQVAAFLYLAEGNRDLRFVPL